MPPSLSELICIIINLELSHLGSNISKNKLCLYNFLVKFKKLELLIYINPSSANESY